MVSQPQPRRIASGEFDWLLVTDAGRPDVFEELYGEYLDGEYSRIYNGGCRNTPEWFERNWGDGMTDAMLFHGGQPIRAIAGTDYDARRHFASVPHTSLYPSHPDLEVAPPRGVNQVVRQHLVAETDREAQLHALGYTPSMVNTEYDYRVVRYLQPHKPYRSLPETAGDARPRVDADTLHDAYRDNYHWVLDAIQDLVADLEGDVVVTSDHGECLKDCGQAFHGPGNTPHNHLVDVPWLEVDA